MALVPRRAQGEAPLPWLVDRLFRNLLVDVTGNTHRAEICIDKLFSPDGPTGRLGLVEFRAFEMPPDARMSLAQQLLLRALIAWFWREPHAWRAGALGHGAARPLHAGAFRLGGFPRRARRSAPRRLPVRSGWFEAQREFRFPFYGEVHARRRRARAAACARALACAGRGKRRRRHGALRRFVGRAAAGRRSTASTAARHVVTCNGRRVPMTATGRPGEFVAGVRFKAWKLPSALHPTIRRPCAADLRHLSTAGTAARSAAASITSRIRAAATTRPSRSTPTRRRPGAWPASRTTATRRALFDIPAGRAHRSNSR